MILPEGNVVRFDGFELEEQGGWTTMKITDAWTSDASRMAASGRVDELLLNYAWGFKEPDLAFIQKWPIKGIRVLARWLKDLTPIHRLGSTLEALGFQAAARADIDLGSLPQLTELSADWPAATTSFSTLENLTSVYFSSYGAHDLTPLSGNPRLTSIRMKQYPQLRSIEGIQEFKHLNQMQIVLATKLDDITALHDPAPQSSLRSVDFDSCKRIANVEDFVGLGNLETLNLANCGPLDSLKPLVALTKLRKLLMYESTVITDGDLSPLLSMPALRDLAMANRRHYQPSVKEVEAILEAHNDVERHELGM
jgi:hypothetical protein